MSFTFLKDLINIPALKAAKHFTFLIAMNSHHFMILRDKNMVLFGGKEIKHYFLNFENR